MNTLNQDQEAAAMAVFQFLLSGDKEFNISGPAGVGKTYLMEYIMKESMKRYEEACMLLNIKKTLHTVYLTATTNKAAEVLEAVTGFPTTTVHSFLGLKVTDDYETGNSKIKKTSNFKVYEGIVLFVDEASMIDSQLHQIILEGTDKNSKIIYVGDHCQMAPVFETISPIYKNPAHFVELLTPMRNAGQPALMSLCNQLRDTVKTGKFKPIREVPGVVDYLDDNQLQYLLDTKFKDEDVNSRVLCFTNNRVQEYNDYIRQVRGYPDTFTKGEMVINNSAIEIGKTMLKVEQPFRVGEVLQPPQNIEFSSNVTLNAYKLRIEPKYGASHEVWIPTDPLHFSQVLKHLASCRDWITFYKLKNNFPDLRMKDAATVYKAQGSTYESVILDLGNIGTCRKADQVARMLYVGASRPTTRLYLYGSLPARYQSS